MNKARRLDIECVNHTHLTLLVNETAYQAADQAAGTWVLSPSTERFIHGVNLIEEIKDFASNSSARYYSTRGAEVALVPVDKSGLGSRLSGLQVDEVMFVIKDADVDRALRDDGIHRNPDDKGDGQNYCRECDEARSSVFWRYCPYCGKRYR